MEARPLTPPEKPEQRLILQCSKCLEYFEEESPNEETMRLPDDYVSTNYFECSECKKININS